MKIQFEARLAFPALFSAKTVNGEGDPAFSASFLVGEQDPTVKVRQGDKTVSMKLSKVIETVGSEKWGAKWPAVKKEIEAKDRSAIHDGDLKSAYAGFPGNFYISARNKQRPLVIDRDKTPLTGQDGKPYAGCYVMASVELWAQDNNYGKRINASLRGCQFLRDGDAFAGGGSASDDEFDAVEAEDAEGLV